jgi:hypothetical protein
MIPVSQDQPLPQSSRRPLARNSEATRTAQPSQLELPILLGASEMPVRSLWCQRWRHRRHSWRSACEGGFDARRYEVHPLPEPIAKTWILAHHYSRSFPSASWRFGLFDITVDPPQLVCVAVFGAPSHKNVLLRASPTLTPYAEAQVLSRFALDDACPANAESWYLARCFDELLCAGVRGIVTFAVTDQAICHQVQA